jgi:hypothetical protein
LVTVAGCQSATPGEPSVAVSWAEIAVAAATADLPEVVSRLRWRPTS